MSKPRVLLSAYQCGPGLGSVSQIGFEWYSRLAKKLPVTLLTHVRNRPALTQAGAPFAGAEIIYIDTEWFAKPLYGLASWLFPRSEHPVFLIASLDYYLYDWLALRTARRRVGEWDIVHQATPVSPLASSQLHRLGLPLVLGPWNGGLRSPKEYPEIMRAEAAWLYPIRALGKLADKVLGATRKAKLILTATAATRAQIPAKYQDKCVAMLENGVDLNLFKAEPWPPAPAIGVPLRIVFVGRLLPVKGVAMLLEAVAKLPCSFRLTIVGSGAEEAALRQQAEALGLGETVEFTGALPLAEVAVRMAQAHVFCLPSVRESGGGVLLEAMAAARPVVALAYGGPAEIVDDEVGRLLPSSGRGPVVAALAQTFTDIAKDPEAWRRRGLAGRARVEREFAWDAKIDTAISLYQHCLESK